MIAALKMAEFAQKLSELLRVAYSAQQLIMNQKISVLTELYYPEETSTGHILTKISEALARQYVVKVVTGPLNDGFSKEEFPDSELRNSVHISRCAGSTFDKNSLPGRLINVVTRSVSLFWAGLRQCEKGEVILVVTNPPTLPIAALLISKIKSSQYVLIIHDVYPDVLDIVGYGHVILGLRAVWKQVNRVVYYHAARIVVLGRDMVQRVERNYLTADHKGKLVCIHNWAEIGTVFPDKKDRNFLLQERNLDKKFVVIYAGNLGRTHGVEVFAEAMQTLRDRDDIHFLTIAAGKKRPWLQQYISEHNLQNTTLIPLEERPRSEQNVSLNAGDVAIISFIPGMAGISVPSRMYNCMAAGKPIIAVADAESELAMVVVEEDIGWVVAPEDVEGLVKTIELAASQPQLCAEMGQRAVAVARSKYTFERAIAGYKEILESLLPEH